MIEEDLFSHLSTNVPLVNERVYPLIMPQDVTIPAIVYLIVTDTDLQRINGQPYGFKKRIQVDCYAKTYTEAKELRNAVKAAMYSFKLYPYEFTSLDKYEKDEKLYRQQIEFYIRGN